MPTDGENVLFDDRAGRNDGVLSQDEIDRLIASIDTEHSYCMDPESEYKKHDHLLWMMADDDERFREYDPLYEDYINDYLYSHGAFNRIREIYTEWDVSEGSFKYLEGMESGYKKSFWAAWRISVKTMFLARSLKFTAVVSQKKKSWSMMNMC